VVCFCLVELLLEDDFDFLSSFIGEFFSAEIYLAYFLDLDVVSLGFSAQLFVPSEGVK